MADQTPLGNLDVVISADWSDLQSEVNAAVAASQTAADAIEAAFNGIDTSEAVASIGFLGGAAQAAGESLSTFGQAAQDSTSGIGSLDNATAPLAGSLSDVGDAAVSAGGDLGGFGSDASQAAGDAHEAEGGVQGLAEQFVALGEALAVTEGLKEFGQEALTAYGTVQSVTIGLTQLTKSAEQADEIVTQIKELAATEPFAFPEIAPTIQKMVALGVSAEQIPGVMQAVADAAAATGNQFSQVANSFDRMTLSGTVSARSLVQLGVNTTQLGAAMGVAADQVKAAFLAMDQTDRITVLEAAMGKFAGAAEAQAQGIAGQWQIFQNTFEEVMVGVGEALAPVVGEILSFGKTVLEETQSAIIAFNELPEPVKEVAVAIGLLAAATVPALALASSLGFAWLGLQQAGNLVTVILQKIGVTGGEAAAGEEAAAQGARDLAAAEAEVGVAGTTASVGIGSAGLAAGALGTSARTVQGPLTELGNTVEELGLAGTEASGGIVLFEQATVGMTASAANAAAGYSALGMSVGELAAVFAGPIVASILVTQSNLEDLKQKWDDVVGEVETRTLIKALQTGDPTAQINALGLSMDSLKAKVLNASTAGATLGQQLEQSAQQPLTALGNLNIDLSQVANALKGMQAGGANVFAALANSPTFSQFEQNIQTLGGDLDKILAKINALAPSVSTYGNTLGITVITQQSFDKGLQDLTANQVKLNAAVTQARGVLDDANTALSKLKPGMGGYSLASQVAADAQLALDKAQTAASGSAKVQKDSIDGVTQAMEQAQEKAQSSISVFQDLATAHSGDADAVGLLAASYTKAESAAKAAGIAFASAEGEAAKQKVAFDQAIASTQAMEGALGQLVIEYNDQLKAGQDTTAIQEQIALSLKDVQSEVTKTGGTYHNATAELIALNVAGQNAMSNLTGEAAVWQGLAGTVGKTATQMVEMSDAFKKVQTDAAAVGLSVQQVGNSLVFAIAPGTRMNDQMVQFVQQLNAAAGAAGNFITINGKLVPMLKDIGDAASSGNAGLATLIATADGGVVAISGLGTAATTVAPKVASIGTAAQQAGPQIIDLTTNMDGAYRSSFIGGPAMVTYGNAIKGVGTAAQQAGPMIINLNKNMDGTYQAGVVGGPAIVSYGNAVAGAGTAAHGAATQVGSFATAAGGIPAIINGVRFDNWENGFFQTGASAQTAAGQIKSAGTATQATSDAFGTLPVRASLVSSAFTDLTTGIKTFDVAGRDADGTYGQMTIQVTGAMDAVDLIGRGAIDAAVYVNQLTTAGHNADGSFSDVTITVTGTTDAVDIMGSKAQLAAAHVQTMGQYAVTCGDECGDLTDEVENFTNAAPSAVSASDNIASGFDTISSAASSAASNVSSLSSAMQSIGSVSMVGSGGSGNTSGAAYLAMLVNLGAPADMIARTADAMGYVEVGNNQFITKQEDVNAMNAASGPNATKYQVVDNGAAGGTIEAVRAATAATTANTTATTANTTATSSNSTALGTGTTAVTAYTGSINLATGAYTAGTQAVTNFGNAVPLGTAAINQLAEGIQTYLPVIAGITDTTTRASQAIQANALAFAGSTSATGAATAAQIEAMYVAEGFSQQMAIAGADAVLGIQNTTTAMVPYAQAVGTLTTASRALSDSLAGSSGLQPAVDSTTASFAHSVSASDSLTKGLGDATTAFAGSSGLNKAVTSIDTAISGPSGLTGALGNLTDAAGQAAGALKSVGTSGGIATSSNPSPGTTTTVTAGPQPPGTGWTLNASGTGWVGGTLPVVPAQVTSGSGTPGGVTPYTPNYPTSLTSADFLGSSGYGTPPTKEQQDYATALAASTDAANAYTDALNSGTDSTDQLFALKQAAVSAWQGLQSMTGGFSETASQASGAAASLGLLDGTVLTGTANMQLATGGLGAFGQELVNATAIIGNQVISKQFSANDPNLTTGLAELAAGLIPGGTAGSEGQVTSPAPLTIQQLNNEISAGIVTPTGTPTPYTPAYGTTFGLNPETGLTPASAPSIVLAPVFQFSGTVVGSNAAQQLVNMVMPQMVAQLRQAGVKI